MKGFLTKQNFSHDRKKVFEPSIDAGKKGLGEETLEEMSKLKLIRNEKLVNAFFKV